MAYMTCRIGFSEQNTHLFMLDGLLGSDLSYLGEKVTVHDLVAFDIGWPGHCSLRPSECSGTVLWIRRLRMSNRD